MDGVHLHDTRKLFYINLMDDDGYQWGEWEWAETEKELFARDRFGSLIVDIRLATATETSAWNDGNAEGFAVTMAEERMANWNGVAYKLTSFDPMVTEEVFTCGVCEKHYDFDKVATISTFYLSVRANKKEPQSNKSILWYVCIDCSKE